MNIQRQLSILSLAIAAALPVALPTAAVAQISASAYDTRISTLGVEQVRRLRPGNVLSFNLTGTPGAAVTLQIAGATQIVQMREARPGEYTGEYTIRNRDRLTAASTVTARLEKYGRTTSAMLASSLLQGASDPTPVVTAPITAFNVTASDGFQPGDEVNFLLRGNPGGIARVAVQGVATRIVLPEVSRGVYEGSYVIRRHDRLRGEFIADGYLLSDRRETSAHFERRFDHNGNETGRYEDRHDRQDRQDGRDSRQQPVAACANCGSVASVELVEVKGDSPNIIGTIAGGLLGGVIGHQVGGGRGKDLATVVGAVGGAYAGNRVENSRDKTKVYRVAVRLEGGAMQNFDYANDPAVQVGTRVKVENGVLIRL